MAKSLTASEWAKISAYMKKNAGKHGLPARRSKSVVLASFNIRKLGKKKNRTSQAWNMLAEVCKRFDFISVQEVQDNLEGLRYLHSLLGREYGVVVSDTTGTLPGAPGLTERLAFIFRWRRVKRTEVASDITYDRSVVSDTLFDKRTDFWDAFQEHANQINAIEAENVVRRSEGKRAKSFPAVPNPHFLTFIRQPLCISVEIGGSKSKQPYQFLAIDCHLLYGEDKQERTNEFYALMRWIIRRAKNKERMYYPNMLLMGDCNLDFDNPATDRERINEFLKGINKNELASKSAAEINFPFLTTHPKRGDIRTAARQEQTYDQIAIVFRDRRLPDYTKNAVAGADPDGYDYGVFNFTDVAAQALFGKAYAELDKKSQNTLVGKFENDFSDHLPIWIRLPMPE